MVRPPSNDSPDERCAVNRARVQRQRQSWSPEERLAVNSLRRSVRLQEQQQHREQQQQRQRQAAREAQHGALSDEAASELRHRTPARGTLPTNTDVPWWDKLAAATRRVRPVVINWDHSCEHCGARFMTGENRNVCCSNGKLASHVAGQVSPGKVTKLPPLPPELHELYSVDSLEEDDRTSAQDAQSFASPEFLNALQAPGIPRHRLCLKPRCTAVITRNLSIAEGLRKSSRDIVKEIRPRYISVQVLSTGRSVLIPRIDFRFDLPHVPATIRRRQFPLRLAYASTFNSAQGLTLDRVFLDLRIKPFGHGQLYTALTRVRRRSDIRILTLPPSNDVDPAATAAFTTTNVVYSELLR